MIVTGRVPIGAVSFVTHDPPDAEDLERWRELAMMPGLAEAEWEGSPGDSVVPARQAPKA